MSIHRTTGHPARRCTPGRRVGAAVPTVLAVLLLWGWVPGAPAFHIVPAPPSTSVHAGATILALEGRSPFPSSPTAQFAAPTHTVSVVSLPDRGPMGTLAGPGRAASPLPSLSGPASSSGPLRLQYINDGLNLDTSGGGTPPDVQIASGPAQEVEFVNVYGEVFNLTGHVIKSYFLGNFFGTGRDFLSDPKILYDNESGRWFASILHANRTTGNVFNALAVSASSNALGAWSVYTLADPTGGPFGDQPILGVSSKLISVSVNVFAGSAGPSGVEFWIINKTGAMSGGTLAYQSYGPIVSSDSSIHPVQGVSPNDTLFMVETGPATTQVRLIEVTGVPPATVTFVNRSLTVRSLASAPSALQPGTSDLVDTGDVRVQSALWNHGTLWLAFNDRCTPAGDTQTRACFRLVEANTASLTVAQDFDVGASGAYLYYPALALNDRGDLTVAYGESSSTVYPSILVTGRLAGDPSGSLRPAATLKAGDAALVVGCDSNGVCRYGDYFGAGQSPGNSTAWVAGEYNGLASYWLTAFALASHPILAVPEVRLVASAVALDVGQPSTITFSLLNSTCLNATGDHCRVSLPIPTTPFTAACASPFDGFNRTLTFSSPGSFVLGRGGYVAVYANTTCSGAPYKNLTVTPVTVLVSSDPTVGILSTPHFPVEVGESFTLAGRVTGGSGGNTFRWGTLPPGCADSQGATLTCAPTGSGSGSLGLNVTDRAGMVANASLPFTVLPNPFVSLSARATAVDVGLPIDLIAAGSGGVGALSYSWSGLPAGCLGGDLAEIVCTPTAGGVFQVSVTVNDSVGFQAVSGLVSVAIYPAPTVTLRLIAANPLLVGTNLTLSAAAAGGSPPYTYSWSGLPSGCPPSVAAVLTCVPGSAGTFHVIAEAADALGGHGVAHLNVTVVSPPEPHSSSGGIPTWTYDAAAIVLVAVAAIALFLVLGRKRA